jgi:beta-mannanase
MRSAAGKLLAVIIPVVLLALASWAFITPSHARPAHHQPAAAQPDATVPVWGVSVPGPLLPRLDAFDSAVGAAPGIVSSYNRFGKPLDGAQLKEIKDKGATPLVQWNPKNISLDAIAAGRYDSYLRSIAASVKSLHMRIIVSFGHEMNGPWWPWGEGHQSPASFIAAWRHIVTTFRAQGVVNVTWLWNPNVVSNSSVTDPVAWWPGSAYVDETGLDGYFWTPRQTFSALFEPGISELRKLAPGKPVIIAETGAYPGPGMADRVTDLFLGAKAAGLAAVVYFDHKGHSDWRIENNREASAAFRAASKEYGHAS